MLKNINRTQTTQWHKLAIRLMQRELLPFLSEMFSENCPVFCRIFYKVKSRSAHMKSHAEQEKKAAALRQREAEERARAAAEAAAVLAARQQNGMRQMGGDSTNDDSSDGEDEEDEDWQ